MSIIDEDSSVVVTVRVTPRSSRTEILWVQDGVLKVKLNAPPVDGAANAELVKLLARKLGVSRSAIELVSGQTSRTKRLRVTGVTHEQVRSSFE